MDIERILEEYRNGDEGKRLRLFLAFRDLRDCFSCIDQERPDDAFAVVRPPGGGKRHIARAA